MATVPLNRRHYVCLSARDQGVGNENEITEIIRKIVCFFSHVHQANSEEVLHSVKMSNYRHDFFSLITDVMLISLI